MILAVTDAIFATAWRNLKKQFGAPHRNRGHGFKSFWSPDFSAMTAQIIAYLTSYPQFNIWFISYINSSCKCMSKKGSKPIHVTPASWARPLTYGDDHTTWLVCAYLAFSVFNAVHTDRVLPKPSDNYVVRYVLVINSTGVMSVMSNSSIFRFICCPCRYTIRPSENTNRPIWRWF